MHAARTRAQTVCDDVNAPRSTVIAPSLRVRVCRDPAIIHRDVKPDNVLLFGDVDADAPTAKLADFSLATFARTRHPRARFAGVSSNGGLRATNCGGAACEEEGEEAVCDCQRCDDDDRFASCGTALYAAPEVRSGRRYGPAVDVYSWAVTAADVIVNHMPLPQRSVGVGTDTDDR
jgi:serine/threonine protein kinase